jgi:hypothetical protein
VAKAFDTVWVKGLLYKLTVLNFPSNLVKIISSHVYLRPFQTPFQSSMATHRVVWAGMTHGPLLSPVLFSQYVNVVPTLSCHVGLPQYADVTTVGATSLGPSLLIGYLQVYLG